MYFALLCCPLLMTNILHLPSGPIVSRIEYHKVVKFFQSEIHIVFPFPFPMFLHSAISSSRLVGTTFTQRFYTTTIWYWPCLHMIE